MRVEYLNARQVGKKLGELIESSDRFFWAVAWATKNDVHDVLLKNVKKIEKIVIGTDFSHTCPDVLTELKKFSGVRVMKSTPGLTFHPKVYCFVTGAKLSAVVGSANFTAGGTCRNEEAALWIEADASSVSLQEIFTSISIWWQSAEEIDDDFLQAYRLRHEANKNLRKKLANPPVIVHQSAQAEHKGLFEFSWSVYEAKLKNMPEGEIATRIEVLAGCRRMLQQVVNFSDLDVLDRKAVAGTIGAKQRETQPHLRGRSWGWFGSMSGAGDFQNRVDENDPHLSAALDVIPGQGAVSLEDYQAFIAEFRAAFTNSERMGGVPTASRLLAMKRPDYFFCVNRLNRVGVCKDFGFSANRLTLDSYWDLVIEPIQQATWWNVPRRDASDGRIWDARAAMLDILYKTTVND